MMVLRSIVVYYYLAFLLPHAACYSAWKSMGNKNAATVLFANQDIDSSLSSISHYHSHRRKLQLLAQRWGIWGPTLEIDNTEGSPFNVKLKYNVSDFINDEMFRWSIWNEDCGVGQGIQIYNQQEGPVLQDSEIELFSSIVEDFGTVGSSSSSTDENNENEDAASLVQQLDGSGRRFVELDMAFNPEDIVDSILYFRGEPGGDSTTPALERNNDPIDELGPLDEIRFCMRLSLWTSPTLADVSQQQQLIAWSNEVVTISASSDLDGLRQLYSGTVQEHVPPPPADDTTTEPEHPVPGLDAYLCDDNLERLGHAGPFYQGSVVRVCVEPDSKSLDNSMTMGGIISFSFTHRRLSRTQPAIVNGEAAGNMLTSYSSSACRGREKCYFETVLFASFFDSAFVLYGSGSATLNVSQSMIVVSDNVDGEGGAEDGVLLPPPSFNNETDGNQTMTTTTADSSSTKSMSESVLFRPESNKKNEAESIYFASTDEGEGDDQHGDAEHRTLDEETSGGADGDELVTIQFSVRLGINIPLAVITISPPEEEEEGNPTTTQPAQTSQPSTSNPTPAPTMLPTEAAATSGTLNTTETSSAPLRRPLQCNGNIMAMMCSPLALSSSLLLLVLSAY